MENETVLCPLIDKEIADVECIENRDCVNKIIVESSMPDKFKKKENWEEICKSCKYHNY